MLEGVARGSRRGWHGAKEILFVALKGVEQDWRRGFRTFEYRGLLGDLDLSFEYLRSLNLSDI